MLSIISALVFDADSSENLFFPFTEQGLRAVLFVGLAVIAIAFFVVAEYRALRVVTEDADGGIDLHLPS